MKFLALLAFVATPCFAEEVVDPCTSLGDLSQTILQAYYAGYPLGDMLAKMEGDILLVSIVMDAYDEPRYSNEEVMASAAFDFRNHWEHRCYTALGPNL